VGELGEWCCDRESSALTLSKARASRGRYGQQPRSVRYANRHFNHTNVDVTMYRRITMCAKRYIMSGGSSTAETRSVRSSEFLSKAHTRRTSIRSDDANASCVHPRHCDVFVAHA
jgi:hypothetical protein